MYYKILKSSLDGISGGESRYASIDEVLREVTYYRGWDSREQLHDAIRRWANAAKPGSVFTTQVTAIVAVSVSPTDCCPECGCSEDSLYYGEITPVEDGHLEQEANCSTCGSRWIDIFYSDGSSLLGATAIDVNYLGVR